MNNQPFELWTVYKNPSDYPDKFVLRGVKVFSDQNGHPDIKMNDNPEAVTDTLEEARKAVPAGLHRFDRSPNDDHVIVEIWL